MFSVDIGECVFCGYRSVCSVDIGVCVLWI